MCVRTSTGSAVVSRVSIRSASHDRLAGDAMCMNSIPTELAYTRCRWARSSRSVARGMPWTPVGSIRRS